MMLPRSLLFLAVLYPFAVLAAPTYLECQLSDGSKYSVTVDEASGKVTHTDSDGSAFNADGLFAANTITYQKVYGYQGLKVTMRYAIDRTNLKFTETFSAMPADPKYRDAVKTTTKSVSGKCNVVKVGARKI